MRNSSKSLVVHGIRALCLQPNLGLGLYSFLSFFFAWILHWRLGLVMKTLSSKPYLVSSPTSEEGGPPNVTTGKVWSRSYKRVVPMGRCKDLLQIQLFSARCMRVCVWPKKTLTTLFGIFLRRS